MMRQAVDVGLRCGNAGVRIDQRHAVVPEQEGVGITHADIALIPVGIAPALVAQVGGPEQSLVRPVEEGRDLGMFAPGARRGERSAVLRLERRLLGVVAEQIGAVDPGLKVAIQTNAVGIAAIGVQQRHALRPADIAGLGRIPFRAVSGHEIVQVGDAAGFCQVTQTVPVDRVDVKARAAGRDVLHHLGKFLPVGQAYNLDRDAGLALPQLLDAGRTGRKWLRQLPDGPVGQAKHNACGRRAIALHRAGGLDGASFRRIGAVLVPFCAGKARRPADHARSKFLGPGLPDESRRDQRACTVDPCLHAGCKQPAPRHATTDHHCPP